MTIWSHILISYKDLKTLVRINFPNWKHTVLNVYVHTSKNILSCVWIWRCGVGRGISGSEFLFRLTMKLSIFSLATHPNLPKVVHGKLFCFLAFLHVGTFITSKFWYFLSAFVSSHSLCAYGFLPFLISQKTTLVEFDTFNWKLFF